MQRKTQTSSVISFVGLKNVIKRLHTIYHDLFMYHIIFHNLNYFAMRHKNVKLSDILTDLDTQS